MSHGRETRRQEKSHPQRIRPQADPPDAETDRRQPRPLGPGAPRRARSKTPSRRATRRRPRPRSRPPNRGSRAAGVKARCTGAPRPARYRVRRHVRKWPEVRGLASVRLIARHPPDRFSPPHLKSFPDVRPVSGISSARPVSARGRCVSAQRSFAIGFFSHSFAPVRACSRAPRVTGGETADRARFFRGKKSSRRRADGIFCQAQKNSRRGRSARCALIES